VESGLLEGFFGDLLVVAPFGGTLGAIMFAIASLVLGRLRGRGELEVDGARKSGAGRPPAAARLAGWCGAGGLALGALSLAAGLLALAVLAVRVLLSVLS